MQEDWKKNETQVAENEMGRQHLNGHEIELTLGIVENRGAWHVAVHGVAKSHI